MKTLSISSVCLVGALMLGPFVAWGATAPQIITGEQIIAGACPCSTVTNPWCPDAGDESCSDRAYRCDTSGEKACWVPPAPQSCVVDRLCGNWYNQSCD